MKQDPNKHHRRSIRLKEYDYSSKGMYYITLCVNNRLCLFGDIVDGEMHLNDAGKMVDNVWREIPGYYQGVDTDEQSVMPNHLHGIIILYNDIVGAPPCGRPMMNNNNPINKMDQERKPDDLKQGQAQGPAPTVKRLSLGGVVGRLKTLTMHKYLFGVKNYHWVRFDKRLWQRNYGASPDVFSGSMLLETKKI